MKLLSALTLLIFSTVIIAKEKAPPKEPDYRKGEGLENKFSYWNLGPIGVYGYVWGNGSQIETSKNARMIKIKEHHKDSPSIGKLQKEDVIMGVDFPKLSSVYIKNGLFCDNAPKVLSYAITEAEKPSNAGRLILNVWRKGKNIKVELKLKVMGTYSATSPYKCPKTEKIIQEAIASIYKNESLAPLKRHRNGLTSSLNGLALLATGDKKHWKLVGDHVKRMNGKSSEDYKKTRAWFLAYMNLLATEYYLITKDKGALPAIEKLSNVIAWGRSAVGTWSHGIADVKQNDGKPFGMPCAYGAMNQITITCTLSLILAQKCGVRNEVIDTAVKKSVNYLRFYTDKGCFPYGDHVPGRVHDNNGSSAQAAIMFSIYGDKHSAAFYARMSLASRADRERGHTGPFFNRLWGPLGAAVGGPHATLEFDKITRWSNELSRRSNGGFIYQSSLRKEDKGKYRNWDTTGARLLKYLLPRKQLYITGKGGYSGSEFSKEEASRIADTYKISPTGKTAGELLKQLTHWSPLVRKNAAIEIGKQKLKVADQLTAMLSTGDTNSKYGACMGLKFAGMNSEKALNLLIQTAKTSKSSTMRYYAIQGLTLDNGSKETGFASIIHKAVPSLVELATNDYPDEYRTWTNTYATFALFTKGVINKERWQKLPLDQRVATIRKVLKSDDGNARSAMSSIYKDLTKQEIAILLPDIYQGVKKAAPSGVMFGKAVRTNGLKILAQNHIAEGVQTGMDYLFEYGHGGYAKRMGGVGAIKYYGQHLPKEFVDKLEKAVKVRGRMKNDFKEMRSTPPPKLIPMEDFMKKYSIGK